MDLGKGRKVRTWGGRNGGKLSRNEAGAVFFRVQHPGDELFCGSRLWPGTCQPSLAEFLEVFPSSIFGRNKSSKHGFLSIFPHISKRYILIFFVQVAVIPSSRSRSSMAVATMEIISMEADGVKWERVGATLKHLKLGALKKIRFPDCLSKDARVSSAQGKGSDLSYPCP